MNVTRIHSWSSKINKTYLYQAISVIIIFLITFPAIDAILTPGPDHSYMWAFNWLYVYDYTTLLSLSYPLGPLAFLKYHGAFEFNLVWAIAFYSLLKIAFILLFLHTASIHTFSKKGAFIVCLLACYFLNIDLLIVGVGMLSLLLFLTSNKPLYLLIPAVLLPVAFLIKSSIGFYLLPIIVITLAINLLQQKKWQPSLYYGLGFLLFYFLVSIIALKSLHNLVLFHTTLFHLLGSYSSALSLYPENNWWLLGLFLAGMILLPLLHKEKGVRMIAVLQFFTFFAVWKHAMSREDLVHYLMLLNYTVLLFSIIIISTKQHYYRMGLLALILILLLVANAKNFDDYRPIEKEVSGINHFNKAVLHYPRLLNEAQTATTSHFLGKKLGKNILQAIDSSSIDVYPYELSYVPANNLNWQPRKTLQSGGMSPWLDQQSANSFSLADGPEMVLMHFSTTDENNKYISFDGRHFFNDEPLTLYTLLNNYTTIIQNSEVMVMRKSRKTKFTVREEGTPQQFTLGEWITIPDTLNQIIRAKTALTPNLLGKLSSFLYKSEACFIDYKLANDSIKSFRFVLANAQDGLWISPLPTPPDYSITEKNTKAIRFRVSNSTLFNQTGTLSWETFGLTNSEHVLGEGLFYNNTISATTRTFDETDSGYDTTLLTNNIGDNRSFSYQLSQGSFSPTFTVNLDTLWDNNTDVLTINASINWFSKLLTKSNGNIVIELTQSEHNFWHNVILEGTADKWNTTKIKYQINKAFHDHGTLKVYVWNDQQQTIWIDDLAISINSN